MATLRQKIATERKIRTLLEQEGLPAADQIEYGYTCIRLIWKEPKLALIIDIDECPYAEEELTGSDPAAAE